MRRLGLRSEYRDAFADSPTIAADFIQISIHKSQKDFSRLTTDAFPWLDSVTEIRSRIRLRAQPLESSLGRVPQAADGTCYKISQTRWCRVAEDCLSPERTFHG